MRSFDPLCRLALLATGLLLSSLSHGAGGGLPAILKSAGLEGRVLSLEPSPVPGLDVVLLKGGRVAYVSRDGQYLFDGRLLGNSAQGVVNLTAPLEQRGRAQALEALSAEHFITYRPTGKLRSYITVFTDVGCPFCQRFHSEIKRLTEAGVGVRYLPYPRGGLNSEDFTHLQSVWCAKDRAVAIERAMNRRSVPAANCAAAAVREGFELGQAIGLKGTPMILLPSGEMITGYRDAAALIKLLGMSSN